MAGAAGIELPGGAGRFRGSHRCGRLRAIAGDRRGLELGLVPAQLGLEPLEPLALGRERVGSCLGRGQVLREPGGLGLQGRDDVRLRHSRQRPRDSATALGNYLGHAALALEQSLSPAQPVRTVEGLQLGERGLRGGDQVVKSRQLAARRDLLVGAARRGNAQLCRDAVAAS